MAIRLQLNARDVTLLPDERPVSDPTTVPERAFTCAHDAGGYHLVFDGQGVTVPDDTMPNLLARIVAGTPTEWQYSSDSAVQTTFRPLNRILQRLMSTPAYQLFRAGFDVGDAIGMFNLNQVREPAIADSFRYLVGVVRGGYGKKGRLFFLPEGCVTAEIEYALLANGKIDSADLFTGEPEANSHVARKLFVPYATPIGFNTRVNTDTENAWRQISDLIRRQGGGPAT